MKIVMASYPRSGSHFFATSFLNSTGIYMHKTHYEDYSGYDCYVTLIRNPFDSIVSRLAMMLEVLDNSKTMQELFIEYKNEYVNYYNYIIKHVDIIFNYNQLTNYVNDMINFICEQNKIEKNPKEIFEHDEDDLDRGFLKTSTTSSHYDVCKEFVKKQNLEECYNIYNIANMKAIIF